MTDRALAAQSLGVTRAFPSFPAAPQAPAEGEARSLSFREVFDASAGYVLHTLRRLGVPERDVEDVAHDVFLVVHRRLHEYDMVRPLKPWLFGVAYRVASDYRKLSRNRHERLVGEEAWVAVDAADERPGAEAMMMGDDRRALLLAALDTLDFERRAVVVLHDVDGAAMPEIAETLGVPLNTAYSRLRLARSELRAAVNRLRARRQEGAA